MSGNDRVAGGVIASGSPMTCRAAASALEAGGNAVDAAVAGVFASCIAEPILTSLAGAGQMLLHISGDEPRTVVVDFFSDAPGLGTGSMKEPPDDFVALHLDFGSTHQEFHVGRGSAAVPGCLFGLLDVQERHGQLALSRVLQPAIDLAEEGVEISPALAWILGLLAPIVTRTIEGKQMFTPSGAVLGAGERYFNREMGPFLERVRDQGASIFREGPIAESLLREFGWPHGLLTPQDLQQYRAVERDALCLEYRGHRVYTLPPPNAGGSYLEYGLNLMAAQPVPDWQPFEPRRFELVCAVLELAEHHRKPLELRPSRPEDGDWESLRRELDELLTAPGPRKLALKPIVDPAGLGVTTHLSVLDGAGNAVSVTSSCGESCGNFVPGTGVLMNNFLGEEGINPGGFFRVPPGERMQTMMAPALVEAPDGSWWALGSGGSNRIRSSMIGVLSSLIDHQLAPAEAVEGPRIHLDESGAYVEAYGPGLATARRLEEVYEGLTCFPSANFFFGGVHVACRDGKTGAFGGAGDSRRGGCVQVVPGKGE